MSRHACRLILPLMLAVGSILPAQEPRPVVDLDHAYSVEIRPLVERYCYDCHSGESAEADLDLSVFKSAADARRQAKAWLKIREILLSGQMPPEDSPQPNDIELAGMQSWVHSFLTREAQARAGDPGPVILRRLSNAEYTYAIHDLTGVDRLEPTDEFPIDGAAGEGFTNVGSGQGMSPALIQKYLDAAKGVAEHAVLLPDGIVFSPWTTRRDQTDQWLARIQSFYRRFTADGGGTAVNLQGIQFETNQGGLLPVGKYLTATLAHRDALLGGRKTIERVAAEEGLNARYLTTLWTALTRQDAPQSMLLEEIRQRWNRAGSDDAGALTLEIEQAQKALWKFNSIGQFGREGGPSRWMEPVAPIVTSLELRHPLPDVPPGSDVVITLAAADLGDGNQQDYVVWQRPRIEFKSDGGGSAHPPVWLGDVRQVAGRVERTMQAELGRTQQYLSALARLGPSSGRISQVAEGVGLNPRLLENWSKLTGIGAAVSREITGRFQEKLTGVQGYEAVNGWGSPQTPSLLTNRSDQPIRILTLTVPARGVTVHPSPDQASVVAWQSPMEGSLRIEGLVADADATCGNGVAWRVEWLSEAGTTRIAHGVVDNGQQQRWQAEQSVTVRTGDVISLVVDARDRNHSCDTTHIELKLSEAGGADRVWNLAADVVDRVLDANPLADSYGNPQVWHFCTTGTQPEAEDAIVPESALDDWRSAVLARATAEDIDRLAFAVQQVAAAANPSGLSEPDKRLWKQLRDWKGPLRWLSASDGESSTHDASYGLAPDAFGHHPDGTQIAPNDLCLRAPHLLEIRLPGDLVAGGEFVATGTLHAGSGTSGSVQLQVLPIKPDALSVSLASPILIHDAEEPRKRIEAAMADFRELFPPALCYARIVPVDEVVTLTLYYREDDHLKRLMLDESQAAELDRLWDELYWVSQEPLQLVVAFEQIAEFATQDRPDLVKAFAPLREPINRRADLFRQRMIASQPEHVRAVLEFADRAWRRPLTDSEQQALRDMYGRLRDDQVPHADAIRLTLARVLTSPAFLYKLEEPGPGTDTHAVSDLELASRLSFFLWSSVPDTTLRAVAESGRLSDDAQLLQQTHRMLDDPRMKRLAIEFACQWLHLRGFDRNDDKNESLYPEFATLRADMYEETVRFFEDMFRHDGSMLDILDADHTFLNEALARHYGIDRVQGHQWRRLDGVRAEGRGGVLGMATFLASQSGASRTSPILRGNWVYETLLGERLPRPPAGVPQLPDTLPDGLTARELIERHSSAPACAKCHEKIDPYGFALEQYDAIGRLLAHPTDTKTTLPGGRTIEGIDGLRDYLSTDRRHDFVRQFCRKLLGYALGREVQLSDEPLLDDMQRGLEANGYRFRVAVETVVRSPQFRMIRGGSYHEE